MERKGRIMSGSSLDAGGDGGGLHSGHHRPRQSHVAGLLHLTLQPSLYASLYVLHFKSCWPTACSNQHPALVSAMEDKKMWHMKRMAPDGGYLRRFVASRQVAHNLRK